MIKLTINDLNVEVPEGTSVLQAAEQIGIEIPRFCYHDRLSVPANCRMCLVEIEGGPPKPQPSCALPCTEGMRVQTDSEMVRKARRGVMEMILINHPLDCPICDQGGECDLQDQSMAYGFDRSRYYESKRAKTNYDLGPLVKTVMTRCIQCTRCVRFCDEIAGTNELGYLNRGEDAEIAPAFGGYVTTELSGNLIDICPVGALTAKPHAFVTRPWELTKTQSIDVHDALGSAIRVDTRGREVIRILPRLNEDINGEWIDDKTRFACDGLKKNRLDRPWIRDSETGRLCAASWDEALDVIARELKACDPQTIAALAGDLCDLGAMVALRDLMDAIGSPHRDCRTDGALYDSSARCGYIFGSGLSSVETADAILLIGTNPRTEAAVLNARIRKTWLERRIPVGLIGEAADLTYPYVHLGTDAQDILTLMEGKTTKAKEFAGILEGAQNPVLILGAGAVRRADGPAVHELAARCADHFGCRFNFLQNAASRVGGLDTGFVPSEGGRDFSAILEGTRSGAIRALYLLGADEWDVRASVGWKTFVIYQGHHGDRGAERADVILPGCAYTEKDAWYVNTEGRLQGTRKACDPPGLAREDREILHALSVRMDMPLPYETRGALWERIGKQWPVLATPDILPETPSQPFGVQGKILPGSFVPAIPDFYQTNAICRASETMAQCTERFLPKTHTRPEAAE